MSNESLLSLRMAKMSDSELKNYTENKDHFQEYAVLSAVLELEKRGIIVENADEIKQEAQAIKAAEATKIETPFTTANAQSKEIPALYSTQSIFIFGALFSVFGGSVLMILNLFQLNKKNSGWFVIIGTFMYSFSLTYIYEFLNLTEKVSLTNLATFSDLITAFLISIISNLIGIYLLYNFIWKKEVPEDLKYKKKAIWKPVLIILAINFIAAILLIASGGIPQM
ncbi:hypothetical protein ACFQ5N_02970 [Lutibacter holmesii]|uniref:Uncharacterized protein n=1 Tax=Lutibacter holmesii TaxID=1137985 RepID=A0ABW3WL02_9FLAO